MKAIRAWKYRLYPSRAQEKELNRYLHECKNLWNSLLEYAKEYYEKTGKFPTRSQLYLLTKRTPLFSQVSQNVADRLSKAFKAVIGRKRKGIKTGFPRFKPIERMKSFTYPQFGFKLGKGLHLSKIGKIQIKKHREIKGEIKTLTIKKTPSGKWFALFTSEADLPEPTKKPKHEVGMDLGIENFAYLSDGETVENPRHLKMAEQNLKEAQRQLSKKKKGSNNRKKEKIRVAIIHEKLSNRRRDFLHKLSRKLTEKYSLIAMENLNTKGMAKGFLAKSILDCSWAEFSGMLCYKAEEAGCEIVLVEPAYTSQKCSSCGSIQRKTLAERKHKCACGASMHRDLNAAKNILARATLGHRGSNASEEETSTHQKWASVFYEGGSPAL